MLTRFKTALCLAVLGLLVSAACSLASRVSFQVSPTAAPSQTGTPVPSQTASPTASPRSTSTHMPSPTRTPSPTRSLTPTVTPSPTITPSPTFSLPSLSVLMQANCRYGPGTAYLYAWGMYAGDTATLWGRNSPGTWLWVQPDNISYQCWIAASVVEVHGDIFSVRQAPVRLPYSTLYRPPEWVNATRAGDSVTVTWAEVPMTEDDFRGYMMEVTLCQAGSLVWLAVATEATSYTFTDEAGCGADSGGRLFAVEKHGYTDPIPIPWP